MRSEGLSLATSLVVVENEQTHSVPSSLPNSHDVDPVPERLPGIGRRHRASLLSRDRVGFPDLISSFPLLFIFSSYFPSSCSAKN